MKLTSEQQAFYEYGRAKLALQLRIDSIREYTILVWSKYYDDMSKSERRIICDQHALGLLVERLREKRAACRAWQRRRCETCLNGDYEFPYICDTCSRSHYVSDNWEPRKEGES